DPDGGKRVKTKAAVRVVPIHPELVRIGLLDHAAKIKEAGHARLFPDLPKAATGYYSDVLQKRFSRFLHRIGAAQDRTSFHSFRHSFRDALREADISTERVRALGGWAGNGGEEEVYGGGFKAATLAAEIAKVCFPGLDLTHLYPQK